MFLFGLYILFGTKGRARADLRPCTAQRDGREPARQQARQRSLARRTPRTTDEQLRQRHRRR